MKRVAIIGCGAIGSELAKAIDDGLVPAQLVALFDIKRDRCDKVASSLERVKPKVVSSMDEVLEVKPDVIVEAASQAAVAEYGPRILERGVDLIVLSVGALLDNSVLKSLEEASRKGGGRVYAPTGAIAGLDAIRALRIVGINKVVLRTRKPPKSLGVDVNDVTVLYRGPAREAVKKYPFNVNVAAALALAAGVEPLVEIVADPKVERNIHEIIVESAASRLTIRVENVPSPSNPRTSYLAALSCIELVRRIVSPRWLEVGT
ncbi:aspartate dehydrogenase [Pyrolobus fumarii 1A]|uniref:L-aspartate dehydrogenase n=1 Tax=Pyrolobus fumarii (strain DSM 11204 / 1A) TaxID=694429 RepID=G0EFA9_PYRF1|nr:aspartate dehydrogenase [Pyrolobus fumarii]AEM38152.1 aspartate dehydrogenase [Pyrolobus fumarii 1A]